MAGPKGKITLEFSGKDAGLAKSVGDVTRALGKLSAALDTLHPKGQRNPFKSMMTNAKKVSDDIKELNGHVRGLTGAFAAMNSKGSQNSFRTMATNAGSMNSAMQQATSTLKTFAATLAAVRVAGAAIRAPMSSAAKSTSAMGAAAVAANASTKAMSNTMASFGRAIRSGLSAAGGGGGRIIAGLGRAIGGLGGPIRGAIGLIGKLASSFMKLFANIKVSISGFLRLDNHIKNTITNTRGLVGHVNNMNSEIIRFASGIRQIGQAMQNMGMTMSVFLSYPISRQLQNATNVAMDFQHAMIEVRKNTGASTPVVAALSRELQDMAAALDGGMGSPTDIVDLAKMQADAARFGIPVENLVETVRLLDQAIVSTDISAQEGVESVVRFMGMFLDFSDASYMANEFERDLRGVLSAVNELGQANPVGEQEIINAGLRIAPTAAQLGFDMDEVLGIATTVASVNASPERAGSQFAAMLTSMVKNSKELATFIGMTHDEFAQMVDANPDDAIMTILAGMRNIPGALEQAKVNAEAFGQVGGKAASSMTNAWGMLLRNMELSEEEFGKGTSLTLEFMRALDSVQNQVGLLKNQFNVMGIAIGEALLPVITQILSYVIPAMKILIEYFRGLSDSTKLWIVGIAALTALLGPLLFILGSLAFSVGILITGMASLFTVFFSFITLPGRLIAGIFGLVGGFGALSTAVGAAVLVLGSLKGAFGQVGVFISGFTNMMYEWGGGVITAFGQGIIDAGTAVYNAVVSVINGIVGLLQAFSPPKEGPLKNIDTWGTNVATTFADAFALGDLSGIEKFASYIGTTLTGLLGGMGAEAMALFDSVSSTFEEMVASFAAATGISGKDGELFRNNALVGLLDVIKAIQDGSGNLDTLFGDLGQYLGPFADQFKSLLGMQLRYNEELEKQRAIQEELDGLDKKTNARVIAIAMDRSKSVSERVAGIRSARRGAAYRKTELQNDLAASQKRSEELDKEIEALKSVTSTIKKFMPDLASAIGGLSNSMDNLADKLGEKDPKESLLDRLTGNMQENLFPEIGDKAFIYAKEYRAELSKVYDDYIAKGMTAEQATIATTDAAERLLNNLRLINGLDPLSRFAPEKGAGGDSLLEQLAGGGAGGLDPVVAFKEKAAAIEETASQFVSSMTSKAAEIKGFFAGVTGKKKESLIFDTETEKAAADAAFAIGEALRSRFTSVTGEIAAGWNNANAAFVKLTDAVNAFVLGTSVSLGEKLAPTDEQLSNMGAVNNILYQMGTALGSLTKGTISVVGFMDSLFKGSNASSWETITNGILSFRDAFVATFVLGGGLSRGANTADILKGIVAPLVQLSKLGFGNLGSVGAFLGQVASDATNILAAASAVGLLVSSLLGASNANVSGPLQSVLTSMNDGKFKETIQEALKLGNPSDPVGKQVVDFINKSIGDADWSGIGTTLAGFVNRIFVGKGTGGIVGILENSPLPKVLGGILDAITSFVGGLELGNFAERIGDIVGGILDQITVENVRGITDPLGEGILGLGKSNAIPGLVSAAHAIISGIVESLADLFSNEDFAPTLSELATSILQGIVDLPWSTAAAGLGDLARAILGAIADAPWADAASELTNLIISLVSELAKPETLGAATEAIVSLAGGIIKGIMDALGTLNSVEDFPGILDWGVDVATAMWEAVKRGLAGVILGDSLPAPLPTTDEFGNKLPPLEQPAGFMDLNYYSRSETGEVIVKNTWDEFRKAAKNYNPSSVEDIIQNLLTGNPDALGDWFNSFFGSESGSYEERLMEEYQKRQSPPPMLGGGPGGTMSFMNPNWLISQIWGQYGSKPVDMPAGKDEVPATSASMPATATPEGMEAYMLSLQASMATWMEANSRTFFAPLYTELGSFIGASIDAIKAMMTVYGTQLSVGFSEYMLANYSTFFAPIGVGLMSWIAENFESFMGSGKTIAQYIIDGVNEKFASSEVWGSITESFEGFVASVVSGHPILNAADNLAGRIVREISSSMMERWTDVKDAIEDLIEKALGAASPAGGGSGGVEIGQNAKGTRNWKGGLTWLHEEGAELVDLPAGSRVHNHIDSSKMLAAAYFDGMDNGYNSIPWKRLDQNIAASTAGGATVIIQGDVIVDSKKRMDDLAEEVSRRIGKNMRMNR